MVSPARACTSSPGGNSLTQKYFALSMQHPEELTSRYQIHESIGRGGMGEVLRATQRSSGEQVAIKALHLDLAPDAAQVQRFLREGEALRRLSHPNIVKCRESFETGGRFYLVLDYVSGGSLRAQLLPRKPLEVGRVVDWMLDIADALTRAHRLQIVHRDIKPDNILLDQDGQARLTDFGVAHLGGSWAPLTSAGTALGTVNYMSPEACQTESAAPAQDLWAFGATLHELLGGRPPFSGSGPGQVIMAILTSPPEPIGRELPPELQQLLSRLLAKEPEQRPASMREVALVLERLSEPVHRLSPEASAPTAEPAAAVEFMPGHLVELEAGQLLWRQGDPSSYVALIEEGELEVIGSGQDGGTLIFTVLQRGEILGEMSCLDGKTHSATVRARGKVQIRRLGRQEYIQWIRSDPERMQKILLMQSERLRRVAGRLMVSRQSLRSRLVQRLLECESDQVLVPWPELADELQVKAASLSKAISWLVGQGCLQRQGKAVKILSRERLRSLA